MVSIISVLLWLWVGIAQAATYYVSTTGNNSNDGLTESTPKRTITHCVSIVVAGDTCLVRGGTYSTETAIRFSVSGTVAAPIVLANYPGESPVIDFVDKQVGDTVTILHANGQPNGMGYITVEGFEIKNGHDGIKFYNMHNSIIRRNWIHDNNNQGILGIGGHHNLFTQNIINHNGNFAGCDAGQLHDPSDPSQGTVCNKHHGMYLHGQFYTITNNLVYDNLAFGLQQNGSSTSTYLTTRHPGPEFSGASGWIVAGNTFAYNNEAGGMVWWGSLTDNNRVENNIFYENKTRGATGDTQGISFSSPTGQTGNSAKNNHFYGSGSGAQSAFGSAGIEGTHYTQSGNVINISAPAFVNGGSNSLPASPDFRLTARAPVNIALANEIPTNGVVGAFKPPSTPTVASIAANKITVVDGRSAAVPVQNLSTTGVTFSCTANVCPGSPAVSSVSRVTGTDNQVVITLSGITSNACVSHADAVTVSYNSSTGSWTGNDNIGPYPGLHQKILSFTSVSVTNNCTGVGPPGGTPSHISYPMENGSGTTVSDTSGNGLHATTSGTWVSGKTGFGINVANGSTQQTTMPYGSGIDPTTQDMTWVVPVFIPAGQTGVTRYLFGPEIGTNQRGYFGAQSGTWRVARKATSIANAGASNLAVVEGWNYLCGTWNASTDTVTLTNNGVTGTGGATGTYTSFTFATNFEFPIIGTNLHTTVPEATFDDAQVFTSIQDCQALYAAWNAPPPPAAGTWAQPAIQFQGVTLDSNGDTVVVGPSVQAIDIPAGGGVVLLFQAHCTNVSDCALTSFKLVYSKNGSATWQQVPGTETADGTWMRGITTEANLNNGLRSTRLTGTCAVTTGSTQVTSEQIPAVDLPQDGCVVLAYIVNVNGTAGVDYFDYKLRTESNADFSSYAQTARLRVVNPMSSAVGF